MHGILYEIRLISNGEYRKVYLRADSDRDAKIKIKERMGSDIEILSIDAKGVKK